MILWMSLDDAAQVAQVGVGVDIEDRLDVVVVHDRDRGAAFHGGQVAQQLRASRRRAR